MEKAIQKIQSQSMGNPVLLAIGDYLISFMKKEPLFSQKVNNDKKSMKEMLDYVMSEAKKQAVNGAACLSDEVVYGLAVHYFDESDIKFTKVTGAVTSNVAQISVKKEDSKPVIKDEPKPSVQQKKKVKEEDIMMSIFDFMGD